MTADQFRFGIFEFDRASQELRREGVLVRLQSQPAQVLGCLLEYAGEVVSREELRQAVWQDHTFVDFERGLNCCIAQIRAALKDSAIEPRFIRTIPKRGYQFFPPVTRTEIASSCQRQSLIPVGDRESESSRARLPSVCCSAPC